MSSVQEYVCQDCGTLLIHNNPLTLESMRDVHKQLCPLARQKLIASEAAKAGDNPALSEAMGLASLRVRNLPEDYPPERREMVWLAGEAAVYAAQSGHDFARAEEFAARARAELSCLAPSSCRTILEALPDRVVHRSA